MDIHNLSHDIHKYWTEEKEKSNPNSRILLSFSVQLASDDNDDTNKKCNNMYYSGRVNFTYLSDFYKCLETSPQFIKQKKPDVQCIYSLGQQQTYISYRPCVPNQLQYTRHIIKTWSVKTKLRPHHCIIVELMKYTPVNNINEATIDWFVIISFLK